jgi:hypothetical protein
MINRPSYAQRTLDLTRHSLQRMPADLGPAVNGLIMAAAPATVDEAAAVRTAAACTRIGGLVSLQRWRRKGVGTRMAVR